MNPSPPSFLGGCTIFKFSIPSILALLSFSGGSVLASDMPQLQFSLKPNLCVLSADEEACYDELEVRWSAPRKLNLCLFQSDLDAPLRCWTEASEGEHRFILSASHNVTFQLREANEKLLVSEAFEVVQDKKKYRRQRRNPWSFF